MPKSKRVTKLEKEKRIFTVMGWIIDGVQDYLILKQAKTQWDITLRQAKNYLKEARESWKQDEDADVEEKRQKKIAELMQLKRSLKPEYKGTPSGIRALLAVEKELIRLDPDLSIKRIDLTTKGRAIDMTPEEREARINELIAKYNAKT